MNSAIIAKFTIVSTMFCGVLIAETEVQEPTLSVMQMLYLAAMISLVGGLASALRKNRSELELVVLLRFASNTVVLGISLACIMHFWTRDNPELRFVAVGVCGIASLGGLGMVDFASERLQKWIEKRFKNDQE